MKTVIFYCYSRTRDLVARVDMALVERDYGDDWVPSREPSDWLFNGAVFSMRGETTEITERVLFQTRFTTPALSSKRLSSGGLPSCSRAADVPLWYGRVGKIAEHLGFEKISRKEFVVTQASAEAFVVALSTQIDVLKSRRKVTKCVKYVRPANDSSSSSSSSSSSDNESSCDDDSDGPCIMNPPRTTSTTCTFTCERSFFDKHIGITLL